MSKPSSPLRRGRGRPRAAMGMKVEALSVSLPAPLASKLRRLAEGEHRKTSSVVAGALAFYVGLPKPIRRCIDSWDTDMTVAEREEIVKVFLRTVTKRDTGDDLLIHHS